MVYMFTLRREGCTKSYCVSILSVKILQKILNCKVFRCCWHLNVFLCAFTWWNWSRENWFVTVWHRSLFCDVWRLTFKRNIERSTDQLSLFFSIFEKYSHNSWLKRNNFSRKYNLIFYSSVVPSDRKHTGTNHTTYVQVKCQGCFVCCVPSFPINYEWN